MMFSDYIFGAFSLLLLWITAPIFLSIISTTAVTVYFVSMTKINVVDKKYNGKWGTYFWSYITYFKKKLK